MKTKSAKNPEQVRALITREIEEIRNDIENLRLTAEASRSFSSTRSDAGAASSDSSHYNRHAYLME
jgi:hypothetical protein